MIKPLLSLALSCLCLTAFAQEQATIYKESAFTLGMGYTMPVGSFGDKDAKPRSFAKNGPLFSFSYAKGLGKHVAVGTTLVRRLNDFDAEAYLQDDWIKSEGFKAESAEGWKSSFAMGDIYLRTPIKDISIYTKLSLGVAFNDCANFKFASASGWGIERPEASATSLAFGLGAGAQYPYRQFRFGLEAGFLATSPEFIHERPYWNAEEGKSEIKRVPMEQNMNTGNVTLFVSYVFN